VIAIDGVGRGDAWPLLAAQLCAAIVLTVLLVWHQLRQPAPLLPLDLLRIPAIGLASLTSVCSYIVQALCFVSLPFYFHSQLGFSAAAVGWALTPWPLAIAIMSPLAGWLSDQHSAGLLGTSGLTVLLLGLIAVTLTPTDSGWLGIAWRLALCGVGFSLFQVSNSRAIIANAPGHRSGGASAIQSASRLFGQAIGAALVAACIGLYPQQGAQYGPILAVGFAVVACLVSMQRLRHAADAA
jgi:DHA2 family multidrug resistance protein-like MFS transporter